MTSREDLDPYVVLGVRRHASPDEIARAYRRAARLTHPDSHGSGAGSEPFRSVSDAYAVLRDPGRRAGYDRLHSFQRQEVASAAGGSVRYAAPGSQHVVLGSRPPSSAGRPGITARDELRAVRGPAEIEELFAVIRSLLRGGW
jgi:curved DNA-binding protein CbpA